MSKRIKQVQIVIPGEKNNPVEKTNHATSRSANEILMSTNKRRSSHMQHEQEGSLTQLEQGESSTQNTGPNIRRVRGPTCLKDVWALPEEQRIVVPLNEHGQPIGSAGGLLGQFLGVLVNDTSLIPMHIKDWRKVPTTCMEKAYKVVKTKFSFDDSKAKKWVLQSLGKKRNSHKYVLKNKLYYSLSREELVRSKPESIDESQWISIATYWHSPSTKETSKRNTENAKKMKLPHTSGTKSFARKAHEMEISEGRKLSRSELYIINHTKKNGEYVNDNFREVAEQITEKLNKELNTNSGDRSDATMDDALGQVLGHDKSGRVRGLGLGVTPTQAFKTHNNISIGTSTQELVVANHKIEDLQNQLEQTNEWVKNICCLMNEKFGTNIAPPTSLGTQKNVNKSAPKKANGAPVTKKKPELSDDSSYDSSKEMDVDVPAKKPAAAPLKKKPSSDSSSESDSDSSYSDAKVEATTKKPAAAAPQKKHASSNSDSDDSSSDEDVVTNASSRTCGGLRN